MAQTFIAEPSNERRASFLTSYARKYKVNKIPVPMAAAQGYDAFYIMVYSLFNIRDGNLSSPAIKAALENKSRTYYGVVATYERPFSLQDKDPTTQKHAGDGYGYGQKRRGDVCLPGRCQAQSVCSKKAIIFIWRHPVSRAASAP